MFKHNLRLLITIIFLSGCFKSDAPESIRFEGISDGTPAIGYCETVEEEDARYALFYLQNTGQQLIFKNRLKDRLTMVSKDDKVYILKLPSETFKYNEEIEPGKWGKYFSVNLPIEANNIKKFIFHFRDLKKEYRLEFLPVPGKK